MDINAGNISNISSSYTPVKTANATINIDTNTEATPELTKEKQKCQTGKEKEMSKAEIDKTTADLNKIMQLLTADLQFSIHEKTQRIMVQLVDTKEQKVLKEFPPHELLDTLAAIRDYIGLLLDKKA